MEYEEEHGVPGSVPKFGAIFMSNVATKKECFRRKLLGLPSAQANFVKQVKAGMVLFLFEFERRELYGVFQACSDGAMNIVPHAFSSSGKQFPAQVHFTPIWYCRPLSEHEFRDAIIENYFSNKKFNFGLSEDQVRRLLWLFNSRKFENKLPQRQFSREASKPIGEDTRVTGNDSFFLRNREEKYVEEDGLFSAISKKYPGNTSSDVGRLDDDRFLKSDGIEKEFNLNNCRGYDLVTEHPRASLGKRRGDNDGRFSMQDTMEYDPDVDHGLGQVVCTDPPGDSLYESGRVVEDRQFLHSDRVESKCIMDSNIGPVVTPEYPGDSLDKVRRPTNDSRFPIRNIIGDKHISANVFGLVKSTDHLENPAFEPRRATDDHRFSKDCRAENFCNMDSGPKCIISVDHHGDRLGNVRRTTDDSNFFVNDRIEIDCDVDNGIRPILSAENLENPVSKLKKATNDGQLLMNDRVEIPIEHFVNRLDYVRRANDQDRFFASISLENEHNVDNGLGSVNSTVHPGYPLDKIRRVADEGMFLKSDGVDNAYNMENCFVPPLSAGYTNLSEYRQSPSSYSSKAILERDYSLDQEHYRPCSALPRSMEQKNSDFPYPASHDAIVTRAAPYFPEVPSIHHRRSSSVGVDCTSHSIQDFPPHHSSGGNLFASTMKQPSPYRLEAKDLSHYSCSCRQTSNSLLSAGYSGKMEAQATGHEGYEDPLFSESASASIPFSRSEIYERQNMHPFIEYDKHVAASQGRYEHKIPQHETNQAFSDEDASPFSNNVSHLHSGSSQGKSNNRDIKYYQCSEGMRSDSKRDRNSVFSRLTFASDVCVQENGTDMGDDECDMDVSVDQVMDTLHQCLNHRIMKVRKFPLVRQHDMEERRSTKKRDMIYNQIDCEKLTMMNLKMENDVKRVIDENCGQIAEETRVVDFKRRSETKKIQDGTKTKGSVEIVEHQTKGSVREPKDEVLDKQHKRRKLVRPVFGKKGQLNEGLSRDGSSDLQLLSHESFSEDNTYQTKEGSSKDNAVSCDDEVKSLKNENRSSPNAGFVQLTCPAGCEDNNTYVEQSSDCGKKNSGNCELVRPIFSGKDSCCEGISSNCTSNLQLSSHEGSNAKENTGSCDELVRSHENDDMSSQNVGFMHVTNPTICEAGNTNLESSDCRQRNAVLGRATLKCEERKDGKRAVPEGGMGDQPT